MIETPPWVAVAEIVAVPSETPTIAPDASTVATEGWLLTNTISEGSIAIEAPVSRMPVNAAVVVPPTGRKSFAITREPRPQHVADEHQHGVATEDVPLLRGLRDGADASHARPDRVQHAGGVGGHRILVVARQGCRADLALQRPYRAGR